MQLHRPFLFFRVRSALHSGVLSYLPYLADAYETRISLASERLLMKVSKQEMSTVRVAFLAYPLTRGGLMNYTYHTVENGRLVYFYATCIQSIGFLTLYQSKIGQ